MSKREKCNICSQYTQNPSKKCEDCHRDHDQLIDAAREIHGSLEIEIDDDAKLSRGDDGVWVQAWVFVAAED